MAKVPEILRTERLMLRPLRPTDCGFVVGVLDDLSVSGMLAAVPHPYSHKDFYGFLRKGWTFPTHHFLIVGRHDRMPFGEISVRVDGRMPHCGSLGYWLDPKQWRNGYMTEAAQAVVEFSRKHLGLARMELSAAADNLPSQRVAIKLGMSLEGVRKGRAFCLATGRVHDECLFGMQLGEQRENTERL